MKKLMLIASLIALMGCANPTMEPYGKFAVEKVSGLSKTIYSPVSGGDMYGADVTYFFLKNVGNASITNITLEITEVQKNIGTAIAPVYEAVTMPDAFTVNPGTLYELFPSGGGSINQLIRIAVNHGEKIGGVGSASVIDYGEYLVKIDINGTSSGTDIETLQVQYTLNVHTATWEFGYYIDDEDTNEAKWVAKYPTANSYGSLALDADFRGVPNQYFYIKNIGNCDIQFFNRTTADNSAPLDTDVGWVVIPSGTKYRFEKSNSGDMGQMVRTVVIKTNNTCYDTSKWHGIADTDKIPIDIINN